MECPFVCPTSGRVEFPLRAIRDIVFIWPIPLPETYGMEHLLVRPIQFRDVRNELFGRSPFGIVLSVGPGYFDDTDQKFYSTGNLKSGDKVLYDSKVPWNTTVRDSQGKEHFIVFCGYGDVWCLVE